ncbi:MAG: DUF4407 domain-containing protein [Thermoanaerobaculia bacterium]
MLAWCGGARSSLVADYPEEQTRLASVGATVLFTGLFAGAASGYAFHTVFGQGPWVPLLAVAWGLMIFNLDRLIVMSMHGSLGRRWLAALPRFFLATVIALVISRPLELFIFRDEIELGLKEADTNAETAARDAWKKAVDNADARYGAALERARAAVGVPVAEREIEKTAVSLKSCHDDLTKAAQDHKAEVDGTGGTGEPGIGPAARTKYAHYLDTKSRCAATGLLVNSARTALEGAIKRQSVLIADDARTRDEEKRKADGLLAKALADRRTSRKDSLLGRHRQLWDLGSKDGSVLGMTLVITLLFWLVESLPVIAKLMSSESIYDERLKQRHFEVKAQTAGIEAARAKYEDVAKRAAELRADNQLVEAEASAHAAQEEIEFRYASLSAVRKAGRDKWQPTEGMVNDAVAAMEQGAREELASAVSPSVPTEPPLDNAGEDAEPRPFLKNWVFPIVGCAAIVVLSHYALDAVSPIDKNNLTIALSIAAIVGTVWTAQKPVSHAVRRFRSFRMED